jgi:preprotein translocase subunit YajC
MELTEDIFKLALQNGIFAVLFVFLFFYVLRENAKREAKYQEIIKKLSTIIEDKIRCIESKIDEMRNRKK